jgi:hypothetical protein
LTLATAHFPGRARTLHFSPFEKPQLRVRLTRETTASEVLTAFQEWDSGSSPPKSMEPKAPEGPVQSA